MSHKVATTIRQLMRKSYKAQYADHVEYSTITHVKLTKDGTRYERYQIVLADDCGRAQYKRWKKKFKKR